MISTSATNPVERLAAEAGEMVWFQLYMGRDQTIGHDLVNRAEACGVRTLVVTADVPVPGLRRRDQRNRLGLPLRVTPAMLAGLLCHPAWTVATLRAGQPRLAKLMAEQSSARFDWAALERIRARWTGTMVLKGVLHPTDAARAVQAGMDAVIVSSHGGRQLDSAPAPVEMLRPVSDAVAGRAVVMLDGGIRDGEDLARAVALGAQFVFVGRLFLWASAALGPEQGGTVLIDRLLRELLVTMGQLGCGNLADLAGVDVLSPWHVGDPERARTCRLVEEIDRPAGNSAHGLPGPAFEVHDLKRA